MISETDTGNKQYWAKWTAITYKITFNGNAPAGASVVDVPGSVDATYGVELPALNAVPKCEGYKFNGFYYRQAEIEKQYYQADGNPAEGIIWDIASDVELLAYWSPIDNKTNSSECLHDSENTVETGDCSIILLVLVMIFSIFALTTVTVAIVYLLLFCSRNSHIS